jgi:RNA polymerase sigma-70 factor (ECF subfamily)
MSDAIIPSWEEVARLHGRTIYNFAYRLTGNAHDAHDLVQEVLLRVRRGLQAYAPTGSFEGWLWRITRNAFLDEIRRRKRRPTVPLPDGDREDSGAAPGPDEELATARLSEDVQRALLELPYDFREAVVLCDVVGLSYEEIADAAAIPVGTVRSRIHRGRRMLRGLLE